NGVKKTIYSEWAELRHLLPVPRGLVEKIEKTIELYPCDLLFIHRDAEKESLDNRRQEIKDALAKLNAKNLEIPVSICVIPIRMQEAWLLFDVAAIRRASGNPNGNLEIDLPKLKFIENIPDPKEVLYQFLREASERTGRRLKKFNVRHSAGQVSQFIQDFSPLRTLSAFQQLEEDIKEIINNQNWT
ncbi:MAG TPA: hypothetical protein VK400_11395, partial [Pyrinomonadaceae bacterium]|nr:hypothetical protein [Pyrinomonadaceae bacterium]